MTREELGRILRAADPAAVLVPQTVLERVVQNVTGTSWMVWRVPHTHCFLVDRATLFLHAEQEEVDVPTDHKLPDDAVLLLARPTPDEMGEPDAELLLRYWRRLFHVAMHRELEARLTGTPAAGLRERIEKIGPAAFEEARNVLVQDGLLPAKSDERSAYIEFVAVYFELKFFAPNLIPVYFPSLPPPAIVEPDLSRDLDAATLFSQTRLSGAPDPAPRTDDQADESHDYYYRLTRGAQRAAEKGDVVGAAILHTRAARVAPASLTAPALAAARQRIYELVGRLQKVLGLPEEEANAWRGVLPSLLDKADQGNRPVEAAILFDLQRACLDNELPTYTLDVVEWLLSAGHRPILRELDGQRFVRVPAHLQSAARKLAGARLTDAARGTLAGLLRDALNRSEERLRERFRPVLTDALHDAGLRPTGHAEEAALAKTVEELLDRISANGFLHFADVRDAIARGQVKLPDLRGPEEYLYGDPLLRLDRRLATLLDGIYRRGEFYTRLLERLTAFNFGTETGRWITRNLTLPFGGAFLIAQFVWLLVYENRRHKTPPVDAEVASALAGPAAVLAPPTSDLSFFAGWNELWWFHLIWIAAGFGFLTFLRSPMLQALAGELSHAAYRAARFVFWDVPVRLWTNPQIHALLVSGPFQLAINYLAKPVGLSLLVWVGFPEVWQAGPLARIGTLLASAFLVNSRLGRAIEVLLLQAAQTLMETVRVAPAIFRWISDIFRNFVDILEWTLARTEDWLRLRGTGGPLSIAVRAVAGVLWVPFAFLLRFYLVVLVEPMVNPLKLPLSILFAKFVYPMLAILGLFTLNPLGSPLVEDLAPFLSWPIAWVLVIGTFYLTPDAVTFLFWEMRENWRLYRANRPASLTPAAVGPHGESVGSLLHPGFHSGTVPRLYSRLRAAERQGSTTGVWHDARTHRQALREVEESVRRFVVRDLIALVNPSPAWAGRRLTAGRVHLGTNRIRVEILLDGTAPAWLEWEDRSGWLVAGWADPGFLGSLPDERARVLEHALAYLYKRAGVDLVREQVQAELPKHTSHFDFVNAGLVVWYGSEDAIPVLYDLAHRADDLRPRTTDNLSPAPGPMLDADRLMFGRIRLTWASWSETWKGSPSDPPVVLLPPRESQMSRLHPQPSGESAGASLAVGAEKEMSVSPPAEPSSNGYHATNGEEKKAEPPGVSAPES